MNNSPLAPKKPLGPQAKRYFRLWGRIGGKVGDRSKKSMNGKRNATKRWANVPRCPTCFRPLPKNIKSVNPAAKPATNQADVLRELEQKEKERLRILQQIERERGMTPKAPTNPNPQHKTSIVYDY